MKPASTNESKWYNYRYEKERRGICTSRGFVRWCKKYLSRVRRNQGKQEAQLAEWYLEDQEPVVTRQDMVDEAIIESKK